jgi:hypothetical protein
MLLLAAALLTAAPAAHAQDDGPRVYQLVPVGAKTFTAFAVAKRGNETPEPGSIDPGTDIDTNIVVLRYVQTFDLGSLPFSPFVIIPVGEVKTSGAPTSSGFGDAQIGATLGLFGAPALGPEQYATFRPGFGMQVLGRVFFPTGDYSAARPVNLGSNRRAWQLGLPLVFARGASYRDTELTSLEVLPTVTFYDDNDAPFAAARSSKDPLFTVEAHLTRNLGRRVWVSADMLYRRGGETTTDGVPDRNGMHGWSAGASFAFPIGRLSTILTWEHVVERSDDGPDGWFFRTAVVAPF